MSKLIILGFDGLEPSLLSKFWAEGRCQNLRALRDKGGYRLLQTTAPAESPVAWASFITGMNPGKHGIFDFLHRDPETYIPKLSIAETRSPRQSMEFMNWRLPIGKPRVVSGRRGTPFWHAVSNAGFPVTIIRVPVTYPPQPFHGTLLSSMGVPDLHGTQGVYFFWTTNPARAGAGRGGDALLITLKNETCTTNLRPIVDPFRIRKTNIYVPVTLTREKDVVLISLCDQSLRLKVGQWSPWIKVTYHMSLRAKATGLVRIYLSSLFPDLNLYCSPVNIDPDHSVVPLSHPPRYAARLKRAIGPYATLGMAEDTWVLNEKRVDEAGFVASCYDILAERERMLEHELRHFSKGLLVSVFDQPDRMQHMFWRVYDDGHPAHDSALVDRYGNVLGELYDRLDAIVGKTIKHHPEATMLVISDHGCKSFRRAFHVNRWLAQHNLLRERCANRDSAKNEEQLYFGSVDLHETKAYALGLSGIYLNIRGRERYGVVSAGDEVDAVKKEIIEKLTLFRDPMNNATVVRRVLRREELFKGPATPDAPDLIVCYNAGYRASWQTALGGLPQPVIEDNTLAWSGDHCIDPELVPGVILSNHPLSVEPLHLMDIGPSVHAYFGLDDAHTFEGRSIWS
jgi:predicted AlkP superfamily phosphohydrolase/phosphomutase